MHQVEIDFLKHILGIAPLSRDEFNLIRRGMEQIYDLERHWRLFHSLLPTICSKDLLTDDEQAQFSSWISFTQENASKIRYFLDPTDPMGYMLTYLRKVNAEAPCQFCSSLGDRKKRLFKTESDARNFAKRMVSEYGRKSQSPYKCNDGNGWHLTSSGHYLVMKPRRQGT